MEAERSTVPRLLPVQVVETPVGNINIRNKEREEKEKEKRKKEINK